MTLRNALRIAALACLSCQGQRTLHAPSTLHGTGGEVRVHARDGSVYDLDSWRRRGAMLSGNGALYDADRHLVRRGTFSFPLADVAVIELSEHQVQSSDFAIAGLGIVTAASAGMTVYCATHTKACFGSCPTFYVERSGLWTVQAEGFSTSVARALEADDLDDLPDARPDQGSLVIAMRNEALETHVTRRVALRVVDAPVGASAYRRFDREAFDALGATVAPVEASDGAAPASLAARDGDEVAFTSDGIDLASRASITLRYPPMHTRRVALALTARNSLMNTFVFYHLLALQGRRAPEFSARLERHDAATLGALGGFDQALGGVDVEVREGEGAWRHVATLPYIGPIARATRAAPFEVSDPSAPVEVRLRFARSHWRFDAALLAPVVASELATTTVWPDEVSGHGRDTERAATRFRGEGDSVLTLPGDELMLRFRVPETRGHASYFLSSRGYYHEWLREEWLRDEDLPLARAYLDDPVRALRELAPAWQRAEPEMARYFEASRFRGRSDVTAP